MQNRVGHTAWDRHTDTSFHG